MLSFGRSLHFSVDSKVWCGSLMAECDGLIAVSGGSSHLLVAESECKLSSLEASEYFSIL